MIYSTAAHNLCQTPTLCTVEGPQPSPAERPEEERLFLAGTTLSAGLANVWLFAAGRATGGAASTAATPPALLFHFLFGFRQRASPFGLEVSSTNSVL